MQKLNVLRKRSNNFYLIFSPAKDEVEEKEKKKTQNK